MQGMVAPTLLALLLALLLTPLVRDWSLARGWVDRPDARRKLHGRPIPRTGGVALVASYLGAYVGALALPGYVLAREPLVSLVRLLPAVAVIFAVGVADDRFDVRPSWKLAGEIVAALCVYAAGVRIVVAGGAGWWSVALTVAWLVLCANAFNLIDGIDGLAAGVALTAAVTMFVAGLWRGDAALCLAAAPLAGCLLGFLRYNFNPASIFLGDSGSLSVGFLLGTYALFWSEKSPSPPGAAPIIALALPLLEVALSLARRFLRNDPIFLGDRGHIHHRLLDRGFTPRRVALALYGAGALCAAVALAQIALAGRARLLFTFFFAGAAGAGVRYLGYAEFRAAGRFLRDRLRPSLGAHVKVEVLERSLVAAASVRDCWDAVAAAGLALGYGRVEARLGGMRFSSGPVGLCEVWQVRVILPDDDYVNISQYREGAGPSQPLAAFIDVVSGALPAAISAVSAKNQPRGSRARTIMPSAGRVSAVSTH